MKRSSMNRSKRRRSETIEEYTAAVNTEGVMVRVRCLRIETGERVRLELHLEGAGQKATVDLPVASDEILERQIAQAAQGFAAALRLRLRSDGRLP